MNLHFCIFFYLFKKNSHSEFFKDFLARMLERLKFEYIHTVTNYKKRF
jgi:hypothetical protein